MPRRRRRRQRGTITISVSLLALTLPPLQTTISDNFAKLAESLYIADRQAREEIAKRAAIQKKLAEKEKEAKEEKLRQLAARAREERCVSPSGRRAASRG